MASNGAFRDASRPPKTKSIKGMVIYRFDAPLFFGNATYFRERVLSLIDDNPGAVKWFLWDAETITSIDSTAAKMLEGLIADLKARNVTMAVARMKGTVRTTISHTSRLAGYLYRLPHFTSLGEAIEAYEEKYGPIELREHK
jgi:MFS superfamily sulfate permease-like transporter